MFSRKKTNILLLIVLSFFLVVCCFFSFFSFDKDVSDLILNNTLTTDLVNGIFMNGKQVVFNRKDNICYLSDIKFLKSNKLKIVSSYSTKSFIDFYDGSYKLVVYTDNFYQLVDIVITNVPIISVHNLDLPNMKVDIHSNDIFNSSVSSEKDISNVSAQFFGNFNNSSLYNDGVATMNIRGASSLLFDKKSYKLKLQHKLNIFDIYEDDVWVMDALVTDKSKIRNKLCSDIWNLINNNQIIDNDLNGNFVELFIDDNYEGLYVLKNKVNKKVTRINGDGLILKSIAHMRDEYIDNLLSNNFSIKDGYFLNYEIKEYNNDSYNQIILKLKDYYENYDYITYDIVNRNFYIDNYINYKIFVTLISGSDNITYNQYLSLQSPFSKILITPWDMDLTFGLSWSETKSLHSSFSMGSSYDINWLNDNIVGDLDDEMLNILKDRYWELRRDVITMNTINRYLDSYKDVLVGSEAAKRDSEKWYNYDVEFEIEQIRKWADLRIKFLDEYFESF